MWSPDQDPTNSIRTKCHYRIASQRILVVLLLLSRYLSADVTSLAMSRSVKGHYSPRAIASLARTAGSR